LGTGSITLVATGVVIAGVWLALNVIYAVKYIWGIDPDWARRCGALYSSRGYLGRHYHYLFPNNPVRKSWDRPVQAKNWRRSFGFTSRVVHFRIVLSCDNASEGTLKPEIDS
jgi:hypothetical protein